MELLGTLIPVATAILGGALAYWVQRDLSNRERRAVKSDRDLQILIERGEELYALADRWQKHAGSDFLMFRKVMQGKVTYSQAFDVIVENGQKRSVNFDRITLILRVYFPSLWDQFDEVHQLVLAGSEIEVDYRQAHNNGLLDGSKHLPLYEDVMIKAEKLNGEFLLTLADDLRKRTGVFSLTN